MPETFQIGFRLNAYGTSSGLAGELGGSVQLNFEPTGVVCVIEAPMDLNETSDKGVSEGAGKEQ